jgi:uncharacterized membrane protein YcaP (DUF421 family)
VTIPDIGSDLVGIVIRSAVVYGALIVGFRVLGKSRTGQLSTIDLIVLLVIANAVQNAMVGENTTLLGGLLAAGVILGLDRLVHLVTDRSTRLRRAVEGRPSTLVDEGRLDEEEMRREGITLDEIELALHQNGLLSVEEARFVFLETTGTITVIPARSDRAAPEGPTSALGS